MVVSLLETASIVALCGRFLIWPMFGCVGIINKAIRFLWANLDSDTRNNFKRILSTWRQLQLHVGPMISAFLLQGSREIYWLFVSIHASLEVWCSEIEKSPSVRKVIFQPSKFDKGLCKFAGMYLLYPFFLPRKDMEEIAGCPRKERVAFLGPRTFSDLVYPSQSPTGRLPDSIKSINSTNQVNQCSLVGTSLEPIPKTSSFLLEQFRQTTRSQRNSLLVKW